MKIKIGKFGTLQEIGKGEVDHQQWRCADLLIQDGNDWKRIGWVEATSEPEYSYYQGNDKYSHQDWQVFSYSVWLGEQGSTDSDYSSTMAGDNGESVIVDLWAAKVGSERILTPAQAKKQLKASMIEILKGN